MTTRSEIEANFTINPESGLITNPGKFEGEPIWAPHFSETASDGEELSSQEDGTGVYASLVDITSEDREQFPELGANEYVLVEEDDQGFVTTTLIADEAEAQLIRAEYEGWPVARKEEEEYEEEEDETEDDETPEDDDLPEDSHP